MKIIIIGLNHAGTSALRTLLSQNNNHQIMAFDKSDNISFLGCGIALSVASKIDNINDLFYCNAHEMELMGANVFMKHLVKNIDEVNKNITIENLNDPNPETNTFIESYDKLIYAAGSWPKNHNFKNNHLENVELCKTYEHAKKIIEKAEDESIRNVAIIGAGYIGIELAESFNLKNKKVCLIDLAERVASNYFDEEFSYKLENSLIDNGIKLFLNTKVIGFESNNNSNKVTHIVTSLGKVKIDYVINVSGFSPNTKLLKNVLKNKAGGIIVDEHMKSSIDDIYAIGDAAAIYNAASKKFENISLATNAVKGGIVVASHINGIDNIKLKSVVGTNAIHVFENNLASTGINEKRCKELGLDYEVVEWSDNDRPEFMKEYNQVSIRMIYDRQSLRLLGAQIYSNSKKETHTECIFFLSLAIQKNMTIAELATTDLYFLPHYNKPFNFILAAILKALKISYIKE